MFPRVRHQHGFAVVGLHEGGRTHVIEIVPNPKRLYSKVSK